MYARVYQEKYIQACTDTPIKIRTHTHTKHACTYHAGQSTAGAHQV